jgi:hypothetical protein
LTGGIRRGNGRTAGRLFLQRFEPCLFANLSDKRTPEGRPQVPYLFWQKLRSALGQDPKKYSCRWVLHLMLISKEQR